VNECNFCGESDLSFLTYKIDRWLCSVHSCKECGEEGYARTFGEIYCDTCFLSEGEGRQCDSCGEYEHIDFFFGSICQSCEDKITLNLGRIS